MVVDVFILPDPTTTFNVGPYRTGAFCVGVANVAQDVPIVPTFRPPTISDTIRGGTEHTFAIENTILVDPANDFPLLSTTLPAGWGVVGDVVPTTAGVVLRTPQTTVPAQVIGSTAILDAFCLTLDVDILGYDRRRPPGNILGAVQFYQSAAAFAAAEIVAGDGGLLVVGSAVPGAATAGGAVAVAEELSTSTISLRLVRDGQNLFVQTGVRDTTGQLVNVVNVASTSAFEVGTGHLRLYANNINGGAQVVRMRNIELRSHVRAGPRLFTLRRDVQTTRLAATTPAATLDELGSTELSIFGPWGTATSATGFTYTLPPVKTVGRGLIATASLVTTQFETLRDVT